MTFLDQIRTALRKIFAGDSLEEYGRFYGCYRGFVHDNQDPETMGRLILEVPQVYGNQAYNYWAGPKGMYAGLQRGFFALPQKGEGVWVSFENGDPQFPIWEYGWFPENGVPTAALADYGRNQVWQSGANRVELNEAQGYFRVTTAAGTVLEVNEQGVSLGSAVASREPALLGDKSVALLDDLLDALIDSKTLTGLGLQPLTAVPLLVQLKARLPTLKSTKVTLD